MFRTINRHIGIRRFLSTDVPKTIIPVQKIGYEQLSELETRINIQQDEINDLNIRLGICCFATIASILMLEEEKRNRISHINSAFNHKLRSKVSNEEFNALKKSHEQLATLLHN